MVEDQGECRYLAAEPTRAGTVADYEARWRKIVDPQAREARVPPGVDGRRGGGLRILPSHPGEITMSELDTLRAAHAALRGRNLALSMTRGQPSDEQLDLSNAMLTAVGPQDVRTPSGVEIRNYPGGVAGIPEARALMGALLGVAPEETIVGNNASLMLMSHVLIWGLLKGLPASPAPWVGQRPKMIVTVPGYDRHFALLSGLGYELLSVPITPEGPDMEQVEALARDDASVKGIFFVPVYSNPTGDSVSDAVVDRLVRLRAAAPDFTVFADNAYAVHHLTETPEVPNNLLRAAEAAGNPDRVVLFASTSKITFASAGISALAASRANIAGFSKLLSLQTIGPNKVEQYRHVRFIESYPGGLAGLMRAHAAIIAPKFAALQRILHEELDGTGLATWTDPKGGYFVSLDTRLPIADRVVALAGEAGVALTPAGATFPGETDPNNTNIRLAPTRPPLGEVEQAMRIVALCIKLASAEHG